MLIAVEDIEALVIVVIVVVVIVIVVVVFCFAKPTERNRQRLNRRIEEDIDSLLWLLARLIKCQDVVFDE